MLDSCRFLRQMIEGEVVDRYVRDRVFRSAVERELQIIGEALLQLRQLDDEYVQQIAEHQQIISFRHVLVHGYHKLKPDVVWNVLTTKLPLLDSQLETLLGEES